MKVAFIDGSSNHLTQDSNYTDAKFSINYMFNSEEELESFTSLFPKYCKITKCACSKMGGGFYYEFGANVDLSIPTNKVTGEFNETAEKRVKKIKSILASL